MSNRLKRRQKTGGFNHKKGNTPYKYYESKEVIITKQQSDEYMQEWADWMNAPLSTYRA